jgi:hypothetical protein
VNFDFEPTYINIIDVTAVLSKFTWDGWGSLWHNLGVAHTAAIFMMEVHWNGTEFSNESQLLAATGLSQTGGD